MSDLVIDACVAIDWFIPSEPGEIYSVPLVEMAYSGKVRVHVPVNFSVEVCGQLLRHHRRSPETYTANWLSHSVKALDAMRISTHVIGLSFKELTDVANAYNLSAYDTAYFHLARLLELPIATRDRGILSACKQWDVLRWSP